MAKSQANGNYVNEQQLLKYVDVCVKPAYDYFKLKFDEDLKPAMKVFKAARLFSPSKINTMRPSPSDVDELSIFPFYSTSLVEELKNREGASRFICL